MNVLKVLNLVVRFLLELCLLAAVGSWGFGTGSGWAIKVILGIGLPVLIAMLWWVAWKLNTISRLVLSSILLGLGAVALFASSRAALGWIYAILVIANQILLIVWKQ